MGHNKRLNVKATNMNFNWNHNLKKAKHRLAVKFAFRPHDKHIRSTHRPQALIITALMQKAPW